MSGCCSGCRGAGWSGEPETNGLCWDCRGEGCAHEPHCDDKPAEGEVAPTWALCSDCFWEGARTCLDEPKCWHPTKTADL